MTDLEGQNSTLLAEIYEGSQDPSLWQKALTRIRERVGGDVGVLLQIDEATLRSELVASSELDPSMVADYAAHWGQHDPWAPAIFERSLLEILDTH